MTTFICSYIKNKWTFKIKQNDVCWVHLVVCRYSQVSDVDSSKSYYPIVNNITLCIQLLMIIHFGHSAEIVNVKTAFLYGDLNEEIYTECSQGLSDVGKDDCIILNKCIYGLVQAARQYYKKAVGILNNLAFLGALLTHASTTKCKQYSICSSIHR